MMNVHAKYITLNEVRKISLPLLVKHFAEYGFSDAEISEDETFDGAPVFRIDAKVEEKVPAGVIVGALDAIHSSLRSKGDERLVFLTTKLPETDAPSGSEEDVD